MSLQLTLIKHPAAESRDCDSCGDTCMRSHYELTGDSLLADTMLVLCGDCKRSLLKNAQDFIKVAASTSRRED